MSGYLAVATEAIKRGFAVTPIIPGTKQGLWGWNRHPATTLSEVVQQAKDFPSYDAGIVSLGRGVDHLMFFDDDSGIAERIERETGRKLPTKCVVRTRPDSAPEKAHYYFKQTAYSMKHLPNVQTNVTDLSKSVPGRSKNFVCPTLYDLKAIGKAGFVIVPGTSRPNKKDTSRQEFYTTGSWTIKDVPPIPGWLVDWFKADIHRFKSEKAKMQKREQRERSKRPTEAEVGVNETYMFLKNRARSFASLGFDAKDIETLLAIQAAKFCENGTELAASDKGKARFHKLAFDPKLRIGHAVREIKRDFDVITDKDDNVIGTVHLPKVRRETPHSICVAAMQGFPDKITSPDAYDLLEKALKTAGHPGWIDRESNTGKRRAARARDEADFGAPYNFGGDWWWERTEHGKTLRAHTHTPTT